MSLLNELLHGKTYVVCWTSKGDDDKENWRHAIGEEKLLKMWDQAVADAELEEHVIAFEIKESITEEEIEKIRKQYS